MENREQYKRLIMFFASALILLVQVVIFYYIWHRYYNYRSVIGALYWRRGNWALMGVYAFINFFFESLRCYCVPDSCRFMLQWRDLYAAGADWPLAFFGLSGTYHADDPL